MVTAVILVALGVLGAALGVGLTPAPRRRGVTPGYVAAGLLVAAGGVMIALVDADVLLATVDVPVLGAMVTRRSGTATAIAEGLALFGGTTFTGGAAVVTAVVLAVRGRRVWALCWVVAVAAGATSIRLLKLSVERPRPPEITRLAEETTTSLPSGHSLMAALGLGLTATAIVLLTRHSRPAVRRLRPLVAVVAVVLAGVIGASRAYLGVHWTTDVVAGWLLGAALVALAATVAADRQPVGERAGAPGDRRSGVEDVEGSRTERPVDPSATAGHPADPPEPPAVGAGEGAEGRPSDR